jgi:hypothetical protein
MLHHVSLPAADFERASRRHDAALGDRRVCSGADLAGDGVEKDPDPFLLVQIPTAPLARSAST